MRLDRRNRTENELGILSSGGLLDLFDNALKEALRINDYEYNYLCEVMNDDEYDLLLTESTTFTMKKKQLIMIEGHLANFKK